MGGKDFGRRLIKIKLASGEIKEIFTAGTLKSGGFEMFYTDYTYDTGEPKRKSDNAKHYFTDSVGIIATKVAVGSDTTVMIVPDSKDTTDEKYFKVDDTYLKNDGEFLVEAYRGSDDGYGSDVLVIYR